MSKSTKLFGDFSDSAQSQNPISEQSNMHPPDHQLRQEFVSTFGSAEMTEAGNATNPFSNPIGTVTGFINEDQKNFRKKMWIFLGGSSALILCCAIYWLSTPVEPPPEIIETPGWQPGNSGQQSSSGDEDPWRALVEERQEDIFLDCESIDSSNDNSGKLIGCKALLKDDESYHGIVWGWWEAVDDDGNRVPFKELEFRNEGYDMTFSIDHDQTLAELRIKENI